MGLFDRNPNKAVARAEKALRHVPEAPTLKDQARRNGYRHLTASEEDLLKAAERYDDAMAGRRQTASKEEWAEYASQNDIILETFTGALRTYYAYYEAKQLKDALDKDAVKAGWQVSDQVQATLDAQADEAARLRAVSNEALSALVGTARARENRLEDLRTQLAREKAEMNLQTTQASEPTDDSLRTEALTELLARQTREQEQLRSKRYLPSAATGRARLGRQR